MEALLPALDGKLPVRINCHTAQDIRNAISFAAAFNLKLIIEGATEAYKVIDEIKQSKSPVVISGILQPGRSEAKDYTRDIALGRVNPRNPSVLAKAGVKFAIYAPTDETIPDLQFIAGYAISQGLSPEEALRAITINIAKYAAYGKGARRLLSASSKLPALPVSSITEGHAGDHPYTSLSFKSDLISH